ncbi:MAG: metallophosphoesterase [Steroidobacteraceae bacterium]
MSVPHVRTIRFILSALLCIASAIPRTGHAQTAQVQWNDVDRTIVFADVHGAGTELRELLRETGVVDAEDRWVAGTAHLVSLGDLLDRGPDARGVMDLLMRLQGEARTAGGQLHVLLGNHEAMNLMGDLRYVDAREYAAYTDLEPAAEREAARKAWEKGPCTTLCPGFDEKFPPGFFGRRAAFAPGGRYGQWLLAQPVAIRINDTLLMHAGPAGILRGMSLQELNLRYRTALIDGLQHPGAEAEFPLLSEAGPNWYRGAALCNEVAEADVLLPLLQQFGAARLVIGHTPTRNSRVVSRFDGKVIKLDTGMNRAAYRGRPSALVIERSGISVRYTGQREPAQVEPEGLFVAPDNLADADVMTVLRDGSVGVLEKHGTGEFKVTAVLNGRQVPAVFQSRSASAIRKELAALQLDRLLGLGIVPATVEREVQGMRGLLQARPQKWMTQVEVQQQGVRGSGWCSVEPQFQLMYALDALLGNELRTAESMVWDTEDWHFYATAFTQAFGTDRGLPAWLRARPPTPGAELRRRLGTLDDRKLSTALGAYLEANARRAILTRRDALLALTLPATLP